MQTGALPAWETSASGPLRPLPDGMRLLEYVESTGAQYVDTGIVPVGSTFAFHGVFAVRDLSTTHGIFGCRNQDAQAGTHSYNAFIHNGNLRADTIGEATWRVSVAVDTPIDYVYTPTKTTINGTSRNNKSKVNALYSFYLFNFHVSYGAYSGGGVAQRVYSWTINVGDTRVRDYLPVKDSSGVAGLWDRVSGEIHYSATATPLVAGPEKVPDTLPALSAAPRNWYAGALRVPAGPAAPDGSVVCDALVLPEGIHSAASNRIVVAEAPMIRALVGRYRDGLAPTNIPVRLAHGGEAVGRVVKLWAVAGSGLWARLRVPASVAENGGAYCSAEALCLRATARDDWGEWSTFLFPWRLTGVALVDDPAIAGTRWTESHLPDADYPDPRTIDNLPILP